MKKNILIISLIMIFGSFFLFVSAQETASDSNAFCREKRSIPRVLPTELQNNYDVKWYFLNLQAENNTVALTGDVTIKAEVTASLLDTFSFHLHQVYDIDSLKINGVLKPHQNNGDERWVTNLSFPAGETIDVQIFYHGTMSSSGGFFSGISSAVESTYGSHVTWTLSEPNNAYEWFPVKQSLTDKADSVWVFVTTSDINKVGSNGLLTNTVPLPNNKVRYEWKSKYPIDYYLISIAIADYQDYSIYATIPQTQQEVLIQNYLYNTPACLEANKTNIDKIKDMMELYSALFGPYPFSDEKYGKCLAPMGGGMEHQTMTTQASFSERLSAHEFTHQWFGDNVTCASWEYIWLNEGFATYGELLWDESVVGKEKAFDNFYKSYIRTVLSYGKYGSVYVPKQYVDDEYRIFNDVLSYAKGGCIIHLLRFMLDDDAVFFNILQTYQERFSGGAAVAEDFQQIAEELSGKDFTDFFNQWFYGEGYPSFRITWKQSENQLNFSSVQTTSTAVTPFFNMPFELKINYSDNTSEIVRFDQEENTQQFTYTVPEGLTINDIKFDPNQWLLASGRVIHDTTPISEMDEPTFSIYPNPANDLLTIYFSAADKSEKEIKITDITGKTMIAEAVHVETAYDLNISSLQSGVYIIQVVSEGQTISRKLIKK